jgi:hypothetical protein
MFVIAVLRGLSTSEEGAGFLFARLISQYFFGLEFFEGVWWIAMNNKSVLVFFLASVV